MQTKTIFSIALAALLALGLAACGGGSGSTKQETTEKVDLTGEWEQTNEGAGNLHVATIVNDTITIYWAPTDGAKALFWAGSVEVPNDAGKSFTWDSVRDKAKTDTALLASQEDTKKFSYDNGIISYEVSALGVSWNVELKQTSKTPGVAPAAATSSEYDVKIESASFGSDYAGKPVIIVNFSFTNNSGKAASFAWSLESQAFQGGVALNDLVIMGGFDDSVATADVQPGVTVSVPKAFLLRDQSTVSVEVKELMSEAVIASQEFTVG